MKRFALLVPALLVLGCGKGDLPWRIASAPPLPPRLTRFDDTILRPLRVPARDPFGYPANLTDKRAILTFAHDRKFGALDSLLDSLEADVNADIRNEYRFWDAFQAFDQPDTALEAPLTEWIAQRDASAHAKIARATYYQARAWHARGSEFASATPANNFRGMDRFTALASADASAGLHQDRSHLAGYTVQLSMAQLYGERDDASAVLTLALREHPASYILRQQYIETLTPRWGGSYRKMDEFAREAAKDSALNPRLVVLQGQALHDRSDAAFSRDDYAGVVDAETKAMAYGADWQYLLQRGWAYYQAGDFIRALDDLEPALQQRPQHREVLRIHAHVVYYLSTGLRGPSRDMALKRALSEYELLAAIDPSDAKLPVWIEFVHSAMNCAENDRTCRWRNLPP